MAFDVLDSVRLLDTPPARGSWNMALDEALMDSVRGGAPPVLRFYRWEPACLSLGRNQPSEGYGELGVDVVRRPTGGRAVLHARELTYSAVLPERALGGPRDAYRAINRALLRGLRQLGVPASLQPVTGGRAAVPSTLPCFRDPAPGEVVAAGRKLIGSAQLRERGVLLQHGSLLLDDDQSALLRMDEPPAVLAEFCRPSWEQLTAALARGWAEEFGEPPVPSAPTDEEVQRARALVEKHSSQEWIWRR